MQEQRLDRRRELKMQLQEWTERVELKKYSVERTDARLSAVKGYFTPKGILERFERQIPHDGSRLEKWAWYFDQHPEFHNRLKELDRVDWLASIPSIYEWAQKDDEFWTEGGFLTLAYGTPRYIESFLKALGEVLTDGWLTLNTMAVDPKEWEK